MGKVNRGSLKGLEGRQGPWEGQGAGRVYRMIKGLGEKAGSTGRNGLGGSFPHPPKPGATKSLDSTPEEQPPHPTTLTYLLGFQH